MKYLLSFVTILVLSLPFFSNINTFANTDGIFSNSTNRIPYENQKLGLEEGVKSIKNIDGLVSNKTASSYIQGVVAYILSFLALISTLMIIYAGFNILTAAGDEEKIKKGKSIIIFSLIGIVIIFLAGPITDFILKILK